MSGIQFCYPINVLIIHILFSALSNAVFTPRVIIPGVPTAGDNFNIICRLDGVVERLPLMPSVLLGFAFPPGGISGETSMDGDAYFRPHIFSPGMTDDVGTYQCRAVVDLPPASSFTSPLISDILQINSKLQSVQCSDFHLLL